MNKPTNNFDRSPKRKEIPQPSKKPHIKPTKDPSTPRPQPDMPDVPRPMENPDKEQQPEIQPPLDR
jgi:hypothetical protein